LSRYEQMTSRRTLKAAEAIREVVSMAILTDLKDPRVRDVTVTYVEVSPDMRQAKVHVSVMGDETKQQLSVRGLQNAAGFLQSKVAKRIDTRYTPRLVFVLDLGVKRSIEISQILDSVLPARPPAESDRQAEPLDEEPLDEEPLDEEPLDEEPLDEEPPDEEHPHEVSPDEEAPDE
jgi:ribosome-binding factor A